MFFLSVTGSVHRVVHICFIWCFFWKVIFRSLSFAAVHIRVCKGCVSVVNVNRAVKTICACFSKGIVSCARFVARSSVTVLVIKWVNWQHKLSSQRRFHSAAAISYRPANVTCMQCEEYIYIYTGKYLTCARIGPMSSAYIWMLIGYEFNLLLMCSVKNDICITFRPKKRLKKDYMFALGTDFWREQFDTQLKTNKQTKKL